MNYLCIPIVLYLEFVKRSSFYSLFFFVVLELPPRIFAQRSRTDEKSANT